MATARPTLAQERKLWAAGHRWVAGLDEVGRGAWAGPVSVGAAVVAAGTSARSIPRWLRDSKLLAEARRESVYNEVAGWCADGAVGHADAAECDRLGLSAALRLAGLRALAQLEIRPDALIVDGPYNILRSAPSTSFRTAAFASVSTVDVPCTVVPVVGGDRRCATVAAASILAKVVRDRRMRVESEHFPAYWFERNKGYPSPNHKAALFGYGLSAIHRRSWAFVHDLPLGGSFGRPGMGRDEEPPDEGSFQGEFDLSQVG
jgi:ribonuclease HII